MIQKWLVTMSLSIFLLTGLSTSSFFLSDFLTQVIEKNEHTAKQLNFAIAQNNKAALLYAWHQSKKGNKNWQELAKKIAKFNGKVAYLLADFYVNKKHVGKKNAYQSEKAMLWYQQAIRLNYPKASIALAELYFQQGNTLAAQKFLAKFKVMELSPYQRNDLFLAVIILKTKIAISTGNIDLTNLLLKKFSLMLKTNEKGASLLRDIERYQILPFKGDTSIQRDYNNSTCSNSIQIFATNLLNLSQVERLVKDFKKQALNDLVCFSPVRYLSLSQLSCSSGQDNAIACDETKLYDAAATVATRYIAIMLPEGGANVHFGIMYFDAQDSIEVVEHEISHLLGFVDEYPLVKGHVKCRTSQQQIFAQNIAVLQRHYRGERSAVRKKILKQLAWADQIKNSTPILHTKDKRSQKNQYWQLGTSDKFKQEVGLYRAETCDNNSAKQQNIFSAFKPLSGRTKLQYDELNFPKQYIELLHKNSERYLMPSFHYNIALAYFQQNNIEQAKGWLEQAVSWESDDRRRGKVRKGGF